MCNEKSCVSHNYSHLTITLIQVPLPERLIQRKRWINIYYTIILQNTQA